MLTNATFFSALLKTTLLKSDGFTVKNSYCEKHLAVHFDDQLKFAFYIEKLCKKANKKLHALARVTTYVDLSKKRIFINAFFDSQFILFPIIWMCHSRKRNQKINPIHKKCVRVIYNEKITSYEESLSKDGPILFIIGICKNVL